MDNSYDYTKDKNFISYEQFINNSLIELGFKVGNIGMKSFKSLILFTYYNKDNFESFNVEQICLEYLKENKIINISKRGFKRRIEYAILNVYNTNNLENNFKNVFNIEFDYYYISFKNLLILFMNILDK